MVTEVTRMHGMLTGYKSLGMGTVTRCLWGDEDGDCGDKNQQFYLVTRMGR